MSFKAVIFDMDGTIIDTETIWRIATKSLIESRGINVTPKMENELQKKLNGLNTEKSCQFLKETFNLQDPLDQLISQKHKIANSMYTKEIKFIEGFEEFHKNIVANNLKTGLATNAVSSTVQIAKKEFRLHRFFGEHIYCLDDVNNIPKPNPAIFLHAAKKLNLDPKDCIVVEDSMFGIKAAKLAGMYCVGINTSKNREQLKEADLIIESYADLDIQELLASGNIQKR
jgi:HAD superfamily hydrolase (TIGR01509 family)